MYLHKTKFTGNKNNIYAQNNIYCMNLCSLEIRQKLLATQHSSMQIGIGIVANERLRKHQNMEKDGSKTRMGTETVTRFLG